MPTTPTSPLRITSTGIEFSGSDHVPASPGHHAIDFSDIEAEMKAFEETERTRLGLIEETLDHWLDDNPQAFTAGQRSSTTILHGGLTFAQDMMIEAALTGMGYRMKAMAVPDNDALRVGKEFGNRGQCNPTYFTVGNLVKHLQHLRDVKGMATDDIIENHIFLTAGACGPCRFGTYATEYRKALRDAGFDGFRVMLFQQQGGLKQATGEAAGLDMTTMFFLSIIKGIVAGDVLNALGYRIRPYEVVPGAADAALTRCRDMICATLRERGSLLLTLLKCRRIMEAVEVDRLQPKPKVMIIGEFWAMTTEGEGNYKLQRFLEQEGAEVDIQLVTAWILYSIWEVRWDTSKRMKLRGVDAAGDGLEGVEPVHRVAMLRMADWVLRATFQVFANAMGLTDYHLPDMDELASTANEFYRNELRGGEGHMEVAKLIQSVEKKKSHMVVSVKPFGCMPSSGVSDGIQTLITRKYPEAIFCPIETSGDGEVNVHSRVQMFLFKARQKARAEFEASLSGKGLDLETARGRVDTYRRRGIYYPPHTAVGTGANMANAL